MPSSPVSDSAVRWGLIAGNGQFPFLVLEAARSQGIDMAVIAIREEASPELEKISSRLHWVSLGELSRTLEFLHEEGVNRAVMAGQVKHNKIFSSIRPDWKLAKLLFSLPLKNTDSLIGAVASVLESEGIQLVDSTTFLKPLIPAAGVLTRRAPDAREAADIAYGREIARQIAGLDLGQTRREGQQAAPGHAIRCTRRGSRYRRSDAPVPCFRARDGRGAHAAIRPRARHRSRRCRRHRD